MQNQNNITNDGSINIKFPIKNAIMNQNRRSKAVKNKVQNNSSINLENHCSKLRPRKTLKSKLPKSYVDFDINVSEISQCLQPKTNQVVNDKTHSKRMELKLKFDLYPLFNNLLSEKKIEKINDVNSPLNIERFLDQDGDK